MSPKCTSIHALLQPCAAQRQTSEENSTISSAKQGAPPPGPLNSQATALHTGGSFFVSKIPVTFVSKTLEREARQRGEASAYDVESWLGMEFPERIRGEGQLQVNIIAVEIVSRGQGGHHVITPITPITPSSLSEISED